ncbi:MAG: bifunctional phosphopantothenoylcysteine decarboxylase/phosphopantothenate--cysteine ligase CoaBC [Armatimonadetes bacterium]|nr:bifunctional phosphopantothenoylcysteine decarboxylase/phosphopantothenate--cysteine ligase CoaBC [Armatimonadota bacterium]
MPELKGRRVVLGVTGSIAAYKAAELASALVQRGAEVWVVMTASARQLVGEATFRALTGRQVAAEMWGTAELDIEHIALADFAEVMMIAPATANILAKMAAGIADDLLTTNLLAVTCPVVVAPAMNARMWAHPAVQENVERLRQRGVIVVEPEEGYLACGDEGRGRLASLDRLLAAIRLGLRMKDRQGTPSPLAGKSLLITAGPTREPLDPVRFLSNPSSGAMGFALATEAAARGAHVTLVHGPTALAAPPVAEIVPVTTAEDMARAVFDRLDATDLFIGAAAVADYRPAAPSDEKIKKTQGPLELRVEPTTDIIAEVRRRRPDMPIVGFAAETGDLRGRAEEKRDRKGLDMIVANDFGPDRGFGPGKTSLLLLRRGREPIETGEVFKDEAASVVLDAVEELLQE